MQHMLPTVKQFPKLEPRFYNGIWLGKDATTGESLVGTRNKVVRARTIRRQIMPHKYNQQLLEDTSINTAYTYSHDTSYNASNKQSTHISEGCSNEHSSRRQETERSTSKRSANKAEENSRANITNGYITNTSEATSTASTTVRDDTIAGGSTDKQQRTTAVRQALEPPTKTEQPKMQNENECHQVYNQKWQANGDNIQRGHRRNPQRKDPTRADHT